MALISKIGHGTWDFNLTPTGRMVEETGKELKKLDFDKMPEKKL
jgi:hypothetical protein